MKWLFALIVSCVAHTVYAQDQTSCSPRADFEREAAANQFTVRASGRDLSGMAVYWYANEAGRWILAITPPGRGDVVCVVAVGEPGEGRIEAPPRPEGRQQAPGAATK